MKSRLAAAAAVAATSLVPLSMAAPADAARCVSGAEIRKQVSTFVHSLKEEAPSTEARTALRGAFVQSVRTARGAKADTPEERKGLGEQISALATQLKDAPGLVERKALIAQIHALQEQKRADEVTEEDVESLKSDLRKVKRALVAQAGSEAQGQQVKAFVHALMAQFDC